MSTLAGQASHVGEPCERLAIVYSTFKMKYNVAANVRLEVRIALFHRFLCCAELQYGRRDLYATLWS